MLQEVKSMVARKYPLSGYILGALTHTTALDRLWGGNETLNCGICSILDKSKYSKQITNVCSSALSHLIL